jgi:hypothetical protein
MNETKEPYTLDDLEIELSVHKPKYFDKLFPGGIAGYRANYALSHPWIILNELNSQMFWAWQRVFKGYDDRIVWGIDSYLSEHIPLWIRELKEKKHGIPTQCFLPEDWDNIKCEYKNGAEEIAQEKFDNILNQIAEGFEAYKRIEQECLWIDDPEYKELTDRYNKGFDLFKEYFGNLWD